MARASKAEGLVLVIEDTPDWMRKLVKACVKAGYEARRASNKDTAISLLRTTTFDAVIADISMKWWDPDDTDGLQSLEGVPAKLRPAVVVVTGVPSAANVRSAFRDFKVIDVIFKGNFDTDLFTRRLESAVRDTRIRRAANG